MNKTAASVINIRNEGGVVEGGVHFSIEDAIEDWLSRHRIEDPELVAQIVAEDKQFAVINNLEVSQDARGQGFGSDLMEKFFDRAEQDGATIVLLCADVIRDQEEGFNLIDWYESFGFEDIGHGATGPLMIKGLN